MKRYSLLLLSPLTLAVHAADQPLIVVEDRGGTSALPYYQSLDPQPDSPSQALPLPHVELPLPPGDNASEADMLPVRSVLLSPGTIDRRIIQAPGLHPLFLIGEDERSRAWLQRHADTLRGLGAVGLVVNVESPAALNVLRNLAPGIVLSPVSADDLAQRLGIRHYPVLITATGIEQ